MFISFYGLLEAGLLILNGIAVLNKERFLNKVGLSVPSNSFEVANPSSFKMQVVNLIAAVQTVMRVPLIAINIFVIMRNFYLDNLWICGLKQQLFRSRKKR